MTRNEKGRFEPTHGMGHRHPTYKIWWHMISRCGNPNDKSYKNYGGRGIRVCADWFRFETFLKDMGHPPEGMQLDRVDNDANYCRSNCRWATIHEQARNKRNNKLTPMAVRVLLRLRHKISTEMLGGIFGVSGRMVRYVFRGEAWSTGAGRATTKKED